MSRLGSKLSKRIMAAALSVAMIMSNMTVYATQVSDDPIPAEEIAVDEDMEILDEAAEVVANVEENTQDADDVDELTYTEVESVEALYSVGAAEINANAEGGIATHSEHTSWAFDETGFQDLTDYTAGYNDLKFSGGIGKDSKGYLTMTEGATVQIPINTGNDLAVKVGYTYAANAKFENEEKASIYFPTTGSSDTAVYYYATGDTNLMNDGYVTVTALAGYSNKPTYLTRIDVVSANRQNITVETNVDNNDVTVTPKITYAFEGQTVRLNDVANVAIAEGAPYEVSGWSVKKGEDEVTVNSDTDGYSFVMPSAAVTVKPIIGDKAADRTVTVALKAETTTLKADDLTGTVIVFEGTNPTNNTTVTVGTDALDSITLKDDTYKVTVYNSKLYWVAAKSEKVDNVLTKSDEFTVSEANTTCTINFDKNPTKWDFREKTFQDYYTSTNNSWYDGLGLTTVSALNNKQYASLKQGSKIAIPVSGKCDVKVTYYGGDASWLNATIGDEPYTSDNETTYEYKNAENGIVEISATGQASAQVIEITYPDTKYSVSLDKTDEHADITDVEGGVTEAAEGAIVKLSKVANVEIKEAYQDSYKLNGWKVTYTLAGESKELTPEADKDGEYTFTMPAADVAITPVIVAKGQKYTITSAESVDHATITPVTDGKVESASAGDKVNLKQVATVEVTETDKANYEHTGWKVTFTLDSGDEELLLEADENGEYTFEMPAANVTVTPIISKLYSINVPAAGADAKGTVTAKDDGTTKATAGKVVKLGDVAVADPNEGYRFKEWKVTYTTASDEVKEVTLTPEGKDYKFTMPEADVTVSAEFEEKPVEYFYSTDFTKLTSSDYEGTDKKIIADNIKGFEYTGNLTFNGSQHGISVPQNSVITLNLRKKTDIIVTVCSYGNIQANGDMAAAVEGNNLDITVSELTGESGDTTSHNFTVKDAEGTVTLTAVKGGFIHRITVGYPTEYTISAAKGDENATVTIKDGKGSAAAGETVTLSEVATVTITNETTHFLAGWTVTKTASGANVDVAKGDNGEYTFTMPAEAVTITPNIGEKGKKYNISLPTTKPDRATVTLKSGAVTEVEAGTKVMMNALATVTIDEEYVETHELSGWTVTYGEGSAATTVDAVKDGDDYSFTMPPADVTVTPVITEKLPPYPTWDFSTKGSPELQEAKGDPNANTSTEEGQKSYYGNNSYFYLNNTTGFTYKGLVVSAGAGAYNKTFLHLPSGTSISIPVSGPSTIALTTNYGQSYYVENEGTDKVQTGKEETTYTYDYTGDKGYVVIKSTGTTYFTKIVVSKLAQNYEVTVVGDEHATVNKVENAPTEFTEGRPVKLNDLVTSVDPASGYEHNGWAVTTVSGEKVDVNYSEADGYTFTMPSEAVTVKPIINPVAQERTVTVAFKAGEETLEATDLTDTVIIFEDTVNLTNKLEVIVGKAGTDLNAIKLKDGTYKVTVYNSKLYVVQPDEFTVSENSLTCTINFDKNPKSWNFNDEVFKKYYGTNTGFGWYNGLELTSVVTNGNKYSKLENGSKIKVPVSGECNVTVTYYGGEGWLGATVGNKPYVGASGDGSVTYHYQGPDAGVVEIAATGQASVWTIDITDPVAAPVFEPTTANESEYTFETKAGDVYITSSDNEAVVKYVVSTDYTGNEAAFAAITEDNILAAGDDKLKEAQPFRVSADGTVIKAVAVKGGITSKLVSYTYNVTETGKDPVDAPTATQPSGTVEVGTEVKLEAAEGAEIYYTLNKTEPSTSSQKYDKENPIKLTAVGEITLKAIAVKDGVTSATLTRTYNVVKVTKLNSVSINGRVKPGETLTASPSFTGTPGSNTTTAYEWYKVTVGTDSTESVEKLTESSNTYTIPEEGFLEAKIRVKVTFTDELGGIQTAEDTTNAITASAITGNGLEIEFDEGKEYTYTGTAIKPAIIVTNNGKELVEGTDYTVKYTNNVKAGKASGDAYDKKAPGVTVTGKGNLSGKISANFTINPQSLKEIDAGDVVVVENSKAALVLLYNGVKLTAKDYEVTEPADFKTKKWAKADEGENKITIKGKTNFSDAAEDAISLDVKVITKEESKNAKIKANFADTAAVKKLTYTGENIEPVMTVSNKANDTDLEKGIDFIVSYPDDAKNVGTKKVTVVGISSRCTGSVTKSYTIKPAKGGTLTVEGVEKSYPFVSTGVTFGKEVKVYYTYTDADNVEQKDELTEGVDYKITYTGNKKAGTAKYAVTGLGNYKGLKTAKTDFTITGLALTDDDDNMDVIVSDKLYTKAAVYKSVPVVIANGTVVKASEYKVEYQIDGEEGWTAKPAKIELGAEETKKTIHVKITAKKATGNYGAAVDEGKELKGHYDVVKSDKADFGKAKITFLNKDGSKAAKVGFTGNEVTPYKALIKCKNVEDVEIILNEDDEDFATKGYTAMGFDVSWAGNVMKGKATVVISATDTNTKYVGSKSATFNIVQKNLQKDLDLAAGEGFKAQSITAFFRDLLK